MKSKMKIKLLSIVLLTGFLSMGSNADFEEFNDPSGGMNTFENAGGSQGTWLGYSAWDLADLQALTTDNRTFELLPNIDQYNAADPYWSDGAGDGNKWMAANALYVLAGRITNSMVSASFSFSVDAFDLDPRYSLTGFIKVLDPDNGYSQVIIDPITITGTGSNSVSIALTPGMDGMVLQAGWEMRGLNANPATNWGSATVTATELYTDDGDVTPPSPDPMTFVTAPYAISDQSIGMTATTATDANALEYYFTCTAGGGNDSGWQSSTSYVDTGLAVATEYTYTVMARDLSYSQNITAPSAPASATTSGADDMAPSPDPMTFATSPIASPVSISMTATTASDVSGVEYYFTSTSVGGHDSLWQNSPTYIDTGLVPNSNYTYTVTARDLSIAMNETAASDAVMVTTTSPDKWMFNSLTGYTGDSSLDASSFAVAQDGLELGTSAATAVISFDSEGATYGEGANYQGRNILRTIEQDYDVSSFEAYATFVFNGTVDQSAYIGMGKGIIDAATPGNWGVPELNIAGANGVVGELKTSSSYGDPKACNLFKLVDGNTVTNYFTDPVALIDTFRVKLTYDAGADTATISVDTNYTGGAFVEDRVLGTVDTTGTGTTNMWYGGPVRVYVGGGEGTVVSDLLIIASNVAVDDLSIAPLAGGGTLLSWEGSALQTYDVQYRADLNYGSWVVDSSPGCSNIYALESGTMSATSTVSGAKGFYRTIVK